jgi:hypothetical protein
MSLLSGRNRDVPQIYQGLSFSLRAVSAFVDIVVAIGMAFLLSHDQDQRRPMMSE